MQYNHIGNLKRISTIMTTRIKTLEQISEQHDRISGYLTSQNRFSAACKVDHIYDGIFARVCDMIGVKTIDDESAELLMKSPLVVGTYQRLP